MPVKLVRPQLSEDRWKEIEKYLCDHWKRAHDSRVDQVDHLFQKWSRNYKGLPAEKQRNFPWVGSSNFVVKLARMFLDTFVARTLNIIFATRPLYAIEAFPREHREALEVYLNRKALYEWGHYALAKDLLHRGNKNGTVVVKSYWWEDTIVDVSPEGVETELARYLGPRSTPIPFEDFAVYPITANTLRDAVIKFHRIRYVAETAKELVDRDDWNVDWDTIEPVLTDPTDVKRAEEQAEAGVQDFRLKELVAVECHLDYYLETNRKYSIVGVIIPALDKMVDLYYNPYPRSAETFHEYKPFPNEDLFYGESMTEIIEQAQEECSQIHNDRRNNSTLANTVAFKRRQGSLVPNPSTSYYPGMVFDLESLEDLDVMSVGRNYSDMLSEENFTISLTERLLGIGPIMQGMAMGQSDKRGIYNTQGVLGVLAESNQRQDTNIRDAREVLGAIARCELLLQTVYRPNDSLDNYPEALREQIAAALRAVTPTQIMQAKFEVQPSNAGANSEVEKASLMQLANVLGQYGTTIQQMVMQLANKELNPIMRLVFNDIIRMHQWMAVRLLRAYRIYDAEGVLPDVRTAIESAIPGGGRGTSEIEAEAGSDAMELGGAGGAGEGVSRELLQNILQLPTGAPSSY